MSDRGRARIGARRMVLVTPMKYRLWIESLEGGVAEDDYATAWLEKMRQHGYDNVRIEPVPDDLAITFPLTDKGERDDEIPSRAAVVRCPHCQGRQAIPGFSTMFMVTCRECGAAIDCTPPLT